jgi:16S rRNA (adenine1518-N6/adenine1519-N6)-dimethyltransferase
LDAQGLYPRKRLGQHFLTDTRILESIAAAAEIGPSDSVLEIGPGLGHLTRVLAAHAGRVIAVELDADLAAKLKSEFAPVSSVAIVHGDILDRAPAEWLALGVSREVETQIPSAVAPAPFKVVANLPYYITSAILRYLLEAAVKPSLIVATVQREVAQRMVARPPAMNLLAVSVQFFARVRIVRTIAPGAFYPRPRVESAVVRLDVFKHAPLSPQEIPEFFRLVHAGFGERRKQLRNSLARGLGLETTAAERLLSRAHVDPTRRAETLGLEEWETLYREWVNSPIVKKASGE